MSAEDWRDFKVEQPNQDEVCLVALLCDIEKSSVEFGKYHIEDSKGYFQLFETRGQAVCSHWLRIPQLPPMHNFKVMGHA